MKRAKSEAKRQTQRLKRSHRRYGAGMSLRKYARDIADQPAHNQKTNAAVWLERKGL